MSHRAILSAIVADRAVHPAFRASVALTISYAPCHHNAIGHCALCALCDSCGGKRGDAKVAHFPQSPERLRSNDELVCSVCHLSADHLDPERVQ